MVHPPSEAEGCDVYIVELLAHTPSFGSAQACPQCNKALTAVGIARVFYSTPDGIRCSSVRAR
jgi:hypothetical protein